MMLWLSELQAELVKLLLLSASGLPSRLPGLASLTWLLATTALVSNTRQGRWRLLLTQGGMPLSKY